MYGGFGLLNVGVSWAVVIPSKPPIGVGRANEPSRFTFGSDRDYPPSRLRRRVDGAPQLAHTRFFIDSRSFAGDNPAMRCVLRNPAGSSRVAFSKTRGLVPHPGQQNDFRPEMRKIPTQTTDQTPCATVMSVTLGTFNPSCQGLFVLPYSHYPRSVSRMAGDPHALSRNPVPSAAD